MRPISVSALVVLATIALSLSLAASYGAARRSAKSHSKTWLKDVPRTSMQVPAVRRRRQASPLTAAQIKESLDHHNTLRASEGADNMQLMVCTGLYKVVMLVVVIVLKDSLRTKLKSLSSRQSPGSSAPWH